MVAIAIEIVLVARLAARAAAFEASARVGTAALSFRSAWAVLAAAGIYGGIAREVAARGPHAWDARVATGKAAKLGWVVKALAQSVARKSLWDGQASREGLWTRTPLPSGEREGPAA